MQPTIIKAGKLRLTGLTGDGSKTGEVWNHFDSLYHERPFDSADENGYEVRFWQNRYTGKAPVQTKSVHVGFLTEEAVSADCFSTVELPPSEYAVFEVYVANGYDSGNARMDQWITDHAEVYSLRTYDGYAYVVACYNDKFKGGDAPDAVVEFWIPIVKK